VQLSKTGTFPPPSSGPLKGFRQHSSARSIAFADYRWDHIPSFNYSGYGISRRLGNSLNPTHELPYLVLCRNLAAQNNTLTPCSNPT
jgi:hypothetical protein